MLPLAAFAQDATGSGGVGSVVDQLCSDKAGLAGLLGYGLTAIGGASILANFRRLMPGPLATIVDFLAANWFRIFEALSRSALDAKPPASRAAPMILLLVLVGGGLSLSSCTTAQLQQATGGIATVSNDVLSTVSAGCREFAPIAAPLTASPDAGLANIAQTGAGMCDLATGKIAASGVPHIDANTAAWLGILTGMLKAASAPVAAAAPAA
jgi:hypothetical protein